MLQNDSPLTRTLQSIWFTAILGVLLLPAMLLGLFAVLFAMFPDAGAGAMVFLPIAFFGAVIISTAMAFSYWLLIQRGWYRTGLAIVAVAACGIVLAVLWFIWGIMAIEPVSFTVQ